MWFDYEMLRLIWWFLLGVLLIGFAVTDGFDLGVAVLLPLAGRNDIERRIIINTVGPVWEGNQVWFILGGGAIFAAWPLLYGVSFSGFYLAMFAVLVAFILRPVGFKFRSKLSNPTWRSVWDIALVIGGLLPAIIFGVAIGNVLQGAPFHFDTTLRSFYEGSFIGLLNPFGLFCGIVSLCMCIMHGANYLTLKTTGAIADRTLRYSQISAIVLIILFTIGGIWIAKGIVGYQLISTASANGFSNPLHKEVIVKAGAWLQNYYIFPAFILAPAIAYLGMLLSLWFNYKRWQLSALVGSGLSIAGIITTVGLSMFPFLLPSSSQPAHSLLIWDASSSPKTLMIMLISTLIFMPIILLYTAWVYRVLRGKVIAVDIESNDKNYY